MRAQEAEFKKNKAVLEQRIEILELQNRELKEREENLKKMNNSIFGALKDFNKESEPGYGKVVKELETSKEQVMREYGEYRIRTQELIKNLETENQELREKTVQLEKKCNQTVLHYEKQDVILQQKTLNLENEKNNISLVLKLYEDERKQYKEKEFNQNELQSKITELRYLMDKQSNDHRVELERVHSEYKQTVTTLTKLFESEKATLETQIHKLLDTKKFDSNLFDDLKKNFETEISRLKKERDDSLRTNQTLEIQIPQLTQTIKSLEDQLSQQKTELEKESKELRKIKMKTLETDAQLRKYEQNEKSLKQIVGEKDYKIEEICADLKKKLNAEKRRYEQVQELAKKYKEEGEKKCSLIMQENMKNIETIKKLKAQIKTKDEKVKKTEMELNKTNTSLVNMSLVSQSISLSKYNPGKSFIQEVKTTRDNSATRSIPQLRKSQSKASTDFIKKTFEKESYKEKAYTNEDEEDPKDLTSENILLGLNSPRGGNTNTTSTYRNHSSNKKEIMESAVLSSRKERHTMESNKKEKPLLNINLCEACQDAEMNDKKMEEAHKKYLKEGLIVEETPNFSNNSFEIKRRNSNIYEPGFNFTEKTPSIYASTELGKVTPIENDSRQFSLNNEFGENINLANSVNDGLKTVFNLNRSASNVSRASIDKLDLNQRGLSSLQQSRIDFQDEISQARKAIIEEQGEILHEKLVEAEQKNEKILLEKERLQVELDRLVLELKQTKMEWALSEESKEECELALKNEIKFLINKLLQLKNTGVSATSSQVDLSQYLKNTMNKSALDHHSSFFNTSEHLNLSQFNHQKSYANIDVYDQNALTIINNNLGERKVHESLEKKPMKKVPKLYPEEPKSPLQDRCMNSGEFDTFNDSDSPTRRVSEYNNNENSLLINLLSTSTNPKKLIKHIKR